MRCPICEATNSSCCDTVGFRTHNGHLCFQWAGFDCTTATSQYGYHPASMAELIENCPFSCGTCRAGTDCTDTAYFADPYGYRCDGWKGYDCTQAVEVFLYAQEVEDMVLKHCPLSCGSCTPLSSAVTVTTSSSSTAATSTMTTSTASASSSSTATHTTTTVTAAFTVTNTKTMTVAETSSTTTLSESAEELSSSIRSSGAASLTIALNRPLPLRDALAGSRGFPAISQLLAIPRHELTGPGMRFLVAWDGSELGTLALRATIHVLSRPGDQLLVYHVRNPGRYGALDEFEFDNLQKRLSEELEGARGLRILSQQKSGEMDEAKPLSLLAGSSPWGLPLPCSVFQVPRLVDAVFDVCDLEGAGLGLFGKEIEEELGRAEFHALVSELQESGCEVPGIVPFGRRGMQLEQLRAIGEACGCGHHDGWLAKECRKNSTAGDEMKEDLYALDRFFVRPVTAGLNDESAWPVLVIPLDVLTTAVIPGRPQESMSFSQLKNPIGLHCDYFVSHSWSHPFAKTLVALDSCAKCCQAEIQQVAFWICLFALNQHDLAGELSGCELERTPFAYGLSKAEKGAVMVLDEGVEPFRRIWCLYEVQRAWELGKNLQLITDRPEGSAEELEVSGQFALTVAEELQSLSAFDARSSDLSDKISIWHKIMNSSVKAAFPVDIFRTHFATGACSIRGFGKAWFTEFDAGVCRLLATPVFNFSMSQADHEIALRYLGLGAQCSLDDLERLSKGIAWITNPSCGLLTHVYAHFGICDLLEYLFKRHAEPRIKRPRLEMTAKGRHLAVAEELLESKALANSSDGDGWTPLICAARAGHDELVELLITHRANLRAVDGAGRSALKHAQLAQHAQVRAKLTEAMRAKAGQDQLKEGQGGEEDEDEEELPEADLSIQSLCLQRP
eukprot:s1384_g5.t3